ncbi:hypothetical protein ACF3MZ_29725 [Paenibacillaceae bacterium WGS1546]|uniref:hypothetical protein n=1 Tax=Cohnella sp. WGS1546 TaxID=3366810 RepID=UPI00372D4D41
MSVLNQNKPFAFVAVFLVLLFGALFVYVVQPLREDRVAAEEQLSRKRTVLNALQQRAANEARNESGIYVKLDQVRRQIPEEPYEELLLRDLRLLETTSGIQMKSLAFQTAEQPISSNKTENRTDDQAEQTGESEIRSFRSLASSSYAPYLYETTVATEFDGSYSRVRGLLEEAETMNRLWHVRNMTIKEKDPWKAVGIGHRDRAVTVKISFVVYSAPALLDFYKSPLEIDYRPPADQTMPF